MDNNNNFNQNFENQAPVEPIYDSVPQGDIPPVPAQEVKNETNGMAIGSLVTGILSVTCCCGNPIGIILSIVAIVLGAISKKQQKENNTMALIGIILGAVGIVAGIVLPILSLVLGTSAGILSGIANAVNSSSSYSYYY